MIEISARQKSADTEQLERPVAQILLYPMNGDIANGLTPYISFKAREYMNILSISVIYVLYIDLSFELQISPGKKA